ncbi:hypothetical protein QYE76_024699 [Lolium multiflorum]|uniref:CCHC-type domain-containing protein n=1 Tax=Lolium multiflorum TaxID=4521 RepID=A0AAD8RFC2_LOLMU|nr:hypothetical protein QYE76_024699 [Lolium multiflorum]
MSLHEDSDQDGDDIPWGPEVTEDLRIHLTSIKDANKNLRKKVVDLSTHIAGVEDRLNVRLTTSDRERDDSLRVVTESLNRLTAAVQRLEARDAAPRQFRSPQRRQGQSGDDYSDVSDARGGHRCQPRRGVEVRHGAGQQRNQGGEAAQEDGGLGRIKVTIPEFSGRFDPEKYLEWEMRVNQNFDGHNYSEEKKVRVACMEFTEYALVWWDNKNRTGERPVTWVDMKRVMQEVFVPAYYTRQFHSKLCRLVQGTKSVDEYYKEMQILMIRTAVRESPEATMVRFFEGLEEKIRDRVDLMQYNDIHELLHQAGRAERWVLEKQTTEIRPSYSSGKRHSSHSDNAGFNSKSAASYKSVSNEHGKIVAAPKEVSQSASSTSHHSNIICHKCGGRGHIMRECPNRKTILLVDDAYISESEDEIPTLEDDTTNDDGTALDAWPALTVPSLMAHKVQRDDKWSATFFLYMFAICYWDVRGNKMSTHFIMGAQTGLGNGSSRLLRVNGNRSLYFKIALAAVWLRWRGRRQQHDFDAGISEDKVGWSSCFSRCWRSIGKQIWVAWRSRPWWAFSGAAAVSSVNKRRLQQLQLLLLLRALLAGHGGEGKGAEGDKELVAAGLSHAATSSFLTVAKDWSSIFYGQDHGVLQRRTDAGGHRRLASAPYGRKATLLSFSFPETKQSEGKAFSSNHDVGPSGSSPAPTSLLWWSDASTSFSGGAEKDRKS